MWLHLYNVEGRHTFSCPLDNESDLRTAIVKRLMSWELQPTAVSIPRLASHFRYSGVVIFGPFAAVYVLVEDEPAHPRVTPLDAMEIWQRAEPTTDGCAPIIIVESAR